MRSSTFSVRVYLYKHNIYQILSLRSRIKAVKKFCIKMHKRNPRKKFVRTVSYIYSCSVSKSFPPARNDKYQKDVKKYWVEKEVEGAYEKEVKRASTRTLNVDMTDEGFDDNDHFGAIDGESACSDSEGASQDGSEPSDSEAEAGSSPERSRKRRSSGSKREDRGKRRRRSRHEDDVSVEEPLEAYDILNLTQSAYLICKLLQHALYHNTLYRSHVSCNQGFYITRFTL